MATGEERAELIARLRAERHAASEGRAERAELAARLKAERKAAWDRAMAAGLEAGRAAAARADYREFLRFESLREAYADCIMDDHFCAWDAIPDWAREDVCPDCKEDVDRNAWASGWIIGLETVWKEIKEKVERKN